jgi:hypothetical protein
MIMVLRPVNKTGSRVPPSDLLDYRTHHDFRAPYCLCTDNPGCGYTETAIYVALEGPNANEYIAGCATDTCGYLSKSLYILAITCLRSLGQST